MPNANSQRWNVRVMAVLAFRLHISLTYAVNGTAFLFIGTACIRLTHPIFMVVEEHAHRIDQTLLNYCFGRWKNRLSYGERGCWCMRHAEKCAHVLYTVIRLVIHFGGLSRGLEGPNPVDGVGIGIADCGIAFGICSMAHRGMRL